MCLRVRAPPLCKMAPCKSPYFTTPPSPKPGRDYKSVVVYENLLLCCTTLRGYTGYHWLAVVTWTWGPTTMNFLYVHASFPQNRVALTFVARLVSLLLSQQHSLLFYLFCNFVLTAFFRPFVGQEFWVEGCLGTTEMLSRTLYELSFEQQSDVFHVLLFILTSATSKEQRTSWRVGVRNHVIAPQQL